VSLVEKCGTAKNGKGEPLLRVSVYVTMAKDGEEADGRRKREKNQKLRRGVKPGRKL
jgi:hypothetical protein